jgi:hypothetical protein
MTKKEWMKIKMKPNKIMNLLVDDKVQGQYTHYFHLRNMKKIERYVYDSMIDELSLLVASNRNSYFVFKISFEYFLLSLFDEV